MSDARIRELERKAAAGDCEADELLRSWRSRSGTCEHAAYVQKVHPVMSGYQTIVCCFFCRFEGSCILTCDPRKEARMLIEIKDGKPLFTRTGRKGPGLSVFSLRAGPRSYSPSELGVQTTTAEHWQRLVRFEATFDVPVIGAQMVSSGAGGMQLSVWRKRELVGRATTEFRSGGWIARASSGGHIGPTTRLPPCSKSGSHPRSRWWVSQSSVGGAAPQDFD